MKRCPNPLDRLFAAAKGAPPTPPETMPGPLQTRLLAHWRNAGDAVEGWTALARVFRRALACAGLVMMVSLGWALGTASNDPADEMAAVNYEMRVDLMP